MPRATAVRLLVARLPVDPDLDQAELRPLAHRTLVLLVAVGGALGALCRALLRWGTDGTGDHAAGWPWDTLVVNVTGSLILGLLLAWLHEAMPLARVPRPLLGTGFCGGFTTFSTFAVEVDGMARGGQGGLVVLYVVASTLAAVAASAVGVLVARAAVRVTDQEQWLRRVRLAHRLRNGRADR